MKRKRIVVLVALGALALALRAPLAAATADAGSDRASDGTSDETSVTAPNGGETWGKIVCYSCIGGTMAANGFATPVGNLLTGQCLDFCAVSL